MIFCFLFDSIIGKFKTSKVKHFNIIPKTVFMPDNQPSAISQKRLSVLITGGNGLIGKYLTASLLSAGYDVSHLSRKMSRIENVRIYLWDPARRIIDPESMKRVDFIIHLAGENIGAKRWTNDRKKAILESRTASASFLYQSVNKSGIQLKAFISASAAGIYGTKTSENISSENDPPADDFLGNVCKQWEEAADLFAGSGIRTVKIRTGIVLEKNDSALSKLMTPGKFGFLVRTGNGLQYMPWIHITDLCNIYLKAIEDTKMFGPYNAVSPQHVTHKDFIHVLSDVMNVPVLPLPVPAFILRAVLGEMSDVILKGSRVSCNKLTAAGYRFLFDNLETALKDVILG
jgi:uncharacterized protein (TIGR01777 family)